MIHTPAVRQPCAFPNHKARSRRSQVLGLLALACAIVTTIGSTATAQATTTPQISGGGTHSCALLTGGSVKCWGWNSNGQLGDGTKTDSSSPVSVSGITDATQLTAGSSHSCALLTGGTVKCWGYNWGGQLGDGTTTNRTSPVSVTGITNATQISGGGQHSCALLTGGTVKCWGWNSWGQLGDGTTTNRTSPVDTGITNATQISGGDEHSCALLTGGTVKCWGNNWSGDLGNGTTTNSSSPVSVTGITNATQISAGGAHSCAVLTGGTVKCWGYNDEGELGNGTTNYSSSPVSVTGITTATQISAGGAHSCALLTGGSVKCWGYNGYGALGNGTTTDSSSPVDTVITNATQISTGWSHACALLTGGIVKCWGANSYGQLGDGTTTNGSSSPVLVNLPDTTAPVAPGSFTGVPSGQTGSTSATIGFTTSEPGGTVECKLDAGSWGACTVIIGGRDVTMVLAGLALGPHTLSARQTDALGNISNPGITATWSVVVPTLPPTLLIPSAGTKTVYKKTVGGVKTWAIKTGLLFSTGGDTRSAAQFMTVQVAVDAAGKPVSTRPSDSLAPPTVASFTTGVLAWSTTGEVTRPSTATPVWVRAGNRLGKWSAWVKLTA